MLRSEQKSSCAVAGSRVTLFRRYLSLLSCVRSCGMVSGFMCSPALITAMVRKKKTAFSITLWFAFLFSSSWSGISFGWRRIIVRNYNIRTVNQINICFYVHKIYNQNGRHNYRPPPGRWTFLKTDSLSTSPIGCTSLRWSFWLHRVHSNGPAGRQPVTNRWPVPNGTHLGDQPVTDRWPESARPPDAGAFTNF